MEIHESITSNPAILAAILGPRGSTPGLTFHGDGSWHPMLQGSLLLMSYTKAPFIRVVAGDHTVVVQREGEKLIGVCFKSGDPIGKSLHRMLRRAANSKARGPRPPLQVPAPVTTMLA